jgi:hypothetical protein
MRGRILVLVTAIVSTLVSCATDSESGVGPGAEGSYLYTSYDTTGKTLVKGFFTVYKQDSLTLSGEWYFRKIGHPQNIGPQVGSGKLQGGIADDQIWINLNPEYMDNNLILTGVLENGRYRGQWEWVSFSGVTNHGGFKAVKN